MFRRFLALTFTAVILGAPVATVVCQITCGDATQQHSCHDDAEGSGTAMSAAAHACGHTDSLPPGRDQAREDRAPVSAIVPAAASVATLVESSRPAPPRRQYSPPLFVSLATPLRL